MTPSDYRAHAEFLRARAADGDVQTLHLVAFTLLNRLRDAQAALDPFERIRAEVCAPLKLLRVIDLDEQTKAYMAGNDRALQGGKDGGA